MDPIFRTVFLGLLLYFVLGAFVTRYIARKQSPADRRLAFIKYLFYLFIVFMILLSAMLGAKILFLLLMLIVAGSIFELCKVHFSNSKKLSGYFLLTLLLFSIVCAAFLGFAFLDREWIIFTYILVMVSDASSQHSGQLFGRHKIFGKTSPNKTAEGLIGGMLMTLLASILLHPLLELGILWSLLFGFTVSVLANLGDLMASLYKRKYMIKDFSKLIPGHGGLLDRFDSFIMAGAAVYLLSIILHLD